MFALIRLLVVQAFLWRLVAASKVKGEKKETEDTHYLFNLADDPYEKTNLYGESEYDTDVDELMKKLDHYRSEIVDEDVPDDTIKHKTWVGAQGIVPWIDDTSSRTIEQKYTYESAPNIIFFLVDDWGYNDAGWQSTYLSWTTPTIDKLMQNGIRLDNYWTSDTCCPARAALLTGRYPFRLGLQEEKDHAELPLTEATLAEEMKTAGYQTYMVGKWHLGMSSLARTPTHRGFDYFYGFYGGHIDYWTKTYGNFVDLHDGDELVSDAKVGGMRCIYFSSILQSMSWMYPRRPLCKYLCFFCIVIDLATTSNVM